MAYPKVYKESEVGLNHVSGEREKQNILLSSEPTKKITYQQ
jgi:hypothetical protein